MITAALHLTAAALLCFLLGDTPPPVFVAALLLALAPDLDTPRSLIGSLLKPISVPLERRVGHRTITHSLLALALVAGVASVLARPWWMVLAGAYASHLALDLLIGRQGIMLLWPSGAFLTLTGWRDDGPAPRMLLLTLLPAALLAALWPQLGPLVTPSITAAAAVANPIATPTPTKAPTPQPTERPSVHLSFTLPSGVGLSALRVRAGDTVAEGQVLASWSGAEPSPWPTPTPPALPPTPGAPLPADGDGVTARAVAEAQAALDALTTAQAAERTALIAGQQRETAVLQRRLADLQRMLGDLQPRHERAQQAAQHAVEQAHQALLDAQTARQIASRQIPAATPDPAAIQRAAERVHGAEAQLRAALDAQDHMRTEQGIERQQAEVGVTQAQADRDALPEQQRQALARLDADHQAARILAVARVASARGAVEDARRAQEHDAQRAAVSATAIAQEIHATATAMMQAHQAAATATAQAWPTPAPNRVISRAAGRVLHVSAEEQDGTLVVSLEVAP